MLKLLPLLLLALILQSPILAQQTNNLLDVLATDSVQDEFDELGQHQHSETPPPVHISARPAMLMVGGMSRVRVRVEPDSSNRSLTVEWYVEPGFENRKFFQLDGDKAPKFYEFLVQFEEAGEWTMKATVKRNDDSTKVATVPIIVRGGTE